MSTVAWFAAEMKPPDWVALLAVVATAVGVVFIYYQLHILSKQVRLQHYSDYTKRYQEIALHFPEDINTSDFSLVGRSDYAPTMRYMRAYFDLCFEEWDLDRKKLIDPQFWSVWKGGMEFAFSKPAFQQAWKIIKLDSSFGREFEAFVDQSMGAC